MQLSTPQYLKSNINLFGKRNIIKEIKKSWYIYLFLIPGFIWLFVFCYYPMYGATLAFKEYAIDKGVLGSPWVGLQKFQLLWGDVDFWHATVNTLRISFFNILIGFPAPIILAFLFNELKEGKLKKFLQTVFTFPNFLSWIILSGVFINFLSSSGFINQVLYFFGMKNSIDFLANNDLIRPILYITNIWKGAGWNSIIYLAAISGIDPEEYEAATIDGANRLQQILYVTWPGIKSTAVILLILAVGNVMNSNFDQIYNISNPVVQNATDVIDTYVYRITFNSGTFDYGYSTAVGLFKSVINFVLLFGANQLAERLGEGGLF